MSNSPQTSEHPLDVLDNAVNILAYLSEVGPIDSDVSGQLLTERAARGQLWLMLMLHDMVDDARKRMRTT